MVYTHNLKKNTVTTTSVNFLNRAAYQDFHCYALGDQYANHVLLHDGSSAGFYVVDVHNGFAQKIRAFFRGFD